MNWMRFDDDDDTRNFDQEETEPTHSNSKTNFCSQIVLAKNNGGEPKRREEDNEKRN